LTNLDLGFADFQVVVLAAFLVVTASLVALFAVVAMKARRNVQFETVTETGYRLRRIWLVFLLILLGSMVAVSLAFLPYSSDAKVNAEVRVTGGQYYWSLSPGEVPVDSEVLFRVTSADVNHGFGVYDPDGYLIGNVQAMPGYENELNLKLEKVGTYVIGCLEYCGVKHHDMLREFEVTP
jgi:cytochrome c oxidase subunit 2